MLKFKKGVKIGNISPQLIIGINVAEDVYTQHDLDCVITSVGDYRHSSVYSEHYQGNAADIRTKNIPTKQIRKNIQKTIKNNLPLGFVLLFENEGTIREHFHLAYRPKYDER